MTNTKHNFYTKTGKDPIKPQVVEKETNVTNLIQYSFPAYGITVMAENPKQAEEKLNKILKLRGGE